MQLLLLDDFVVAMRQGPVSTRSSRMRKWPYILALIIFFANNHAFTLNRIIYQRMVPSSTNSDDDEAYKNAEETFSVTPRKFTGQSPSLFENSSTPRDRIREQEFNLVSAATSPQAFLFQAAVTVALLGFVLYVGSTGQLGVNNDFEDDEEMITIPVERNSIWL